MRTVGVAIEEINVHPVNVDPHVVVHVHPHPDLPHLAQLNLLHFPDPHFPAPRARIVHGRHLDELDRFVRSSTSGGGVLGGDGGGTCQDGLGRRARGRRGRERGRLVGGAGWFAVVCQMRRGGGGGRGEGPGGGGGSGSGGCGGCD